MAKVVTLGEIMLRLATVAGTRIDCSHQFQAMYGGGEANVAISLANFGHQAAFVSKVPNNALGRAVKKHLNSYGVSTEYLLFGGDRLGTYYMEAGVGERAASVIYDRSHSSFAVMEELEWNFVEMLKDVDLLHLSGITPALSKRWESLLLEIIENAKKVKVKISFDINYRGKLWSQSEAGSFLEKVLPQVDYCSAGKMDAIYLLGIEPYQGNEEELIYYYQKIQELYPNIQVLYSTKRTVYSASSNDLVGTLWLDQKYYESSLHKMDPIVDRVGGGDAFSAGVLHGILSGYSAQQIVDFATTASALKHTVQGDCNPFTISDIEAFTASGSGKIIR
ncbi:sugar kinase [Paenibacillus larvae]